MKAQIERTIHRRKQRNTGEGADQEWHASKEHPEDLDKPPPPPSLTLLLPLLEVDGSTHIPGLRQ